MTVPYVTTGGILHHPSHEKKDHFGTRVRCRFAASQHACPCSDADNFADPLGCSTRNVRGNRGDSAGKPHAS